jgi:hypothetical protein
MDTHVSFQTVLTTKTFTTQNTGQWIVIIMLVRMLFQTCQVTERQITHITTIRSLIAVHNFMTFQIPFKGKHFVTNITSKWTHVAMHTVMVLLNFSIRTKRFVTHITDVRTITAVHALKMLLQVTLITVEHVAHDARERTLSSMQPFMFLQITLIIK